LAGWQYPPPLWCVVSFLCPSGGKVNFLREGNLNLELPHNARMKKFDRKLWNQQRETKVFVPKLCNEHQKQMYLFLNYGMKEENPFLNYGTNEEKLTYSFFNYQCFDIATLTTRLDLMQ
jgi:hypothetical protein